MGEYDDIINSRRHVSNKYPQMKREDRAAQFSPFAALAGFSGIIESATEEPSLKADIGEERERELNEKIKSLAEKIKSRPKAVITYYSDEKGRYVTKDVTVKQINAELKFIFTDGGRIDFDCIFDIGDF